MSGPICGSNATTDDGSARLTRRAVIGRISKGAMVAGVSVWVIPEIVIARPTAAAALSAPGVLPLDPGDPGVPGDPFARTGVGNANQSSVGGVPATGDPFAGADPGAGGSGAAGGSGGSGGSGVSGSTGGTGGAHASSGLGADVNRALAFTGLDSLRNAEVGSALVVGGWALTRWASSRAAASSRDTPAGHEPASGE